MAGIRTDAPGAGPQAPRLVLAVTLFVLTGFVGRATIIDGEALSLIWPAAGVAALWVSTGNRRTWPTDLTAIALASYLVNAATGASPALAGVFMITNLAQVIVFVFLTRRWLADVWGFGGTDQLGRLRDLSLLSAASTLACLLGALGGAGGLWLTTGSSDISNFAVWWGRNTVAMIVVVTFGVLAGAPLAGAGSARATLRIIGRALRPRSVLRGVEIALLLIASAAVFVLLFLSPEAGPLVFMILIMSVWAGIRFAPLAVTVHGIAMGAVGITFTLHGIGPFAAIESLHYRALVAQLFVAMAVLKGLALAFGRVERDRAIHDLATARRAADDRALLLDAVLESMTESVVVLDDGGTVLVRNRAGRELAALLGEVHDRVQPAASYGIFHANGLPIGDDELPGARALNGETVEAFEIHLRPPVPGDGRILEVSARPLAGEDPQAPRRAMVNTRDVTADRQHRDALASFAGVIAHDLVNPLTVVDGWAEALSSEFAMGPVSPTVGNALLDRIHGAAAHMRTFIADLLSATVARDQTLRLGPVDLTRTVEELAGLRMPHGTEPLIVVDPGLRAWADEALVRQLLDNLIGNATKYVAPGVRPRVEVSGTPTGDWLEVRVTDNGIGIPEDQREQVFENFHRAHPEEFRGTGLGLAICRRIVDRHGGTIAAAPAAGGIGTVFTFALPRIADAEPLPAPRPASHVA